jgi:regulator of sigma E protease
VKVDRFSFGLGPEMIGFQWGETRYCIAWIPLGGEVRMAGEMELEEASETKPVDPRGFYAQPWYRRTAIALAGPAMNYVLAFAFFSLVAGIWGDAQPTREPLVGELMEGYPAAQAGLKSGDRVLSVEGTPVTTWEQLAQRIHQRPNEKVRLEIQRNGETTTYTVTPREDPASGVGLIGIAPAMIYSRVGPFAAIARGAEQTAGWTVLTLSYLGEKIVKREKPDLAGPLGIANVVVKASKSGLRDFVYLIALLSVGIGLFNLFPIPLLDGGHIVFFLWEGLTKRPASKKVVQTANVVGLSLLLGVLFFATYSDIQRMRPVKTPPEISAPAQP